MNIHDFVVGLQTIFDANDPSDGIDRHDGFGKQVRVTGLKIVGGDERGELQVSFEFNLPGYWKFKRVPRAGTTRVSFGTQWLAASGITTPAEYVSDIARAVEMAVGSLVQETVAGKRHRKIDPAQVDREVAPVDELWKHLVADLGADNVSAHESGPGVIEVIEDWGGGQRDPLWVHVTPDQWRTYVVACELGARSDSGEDAWSAGDGPGMAMLYLNEMIGSRWDDEDHIVFFKEDFEASIRAELPPVRSPELRRRNSFDDGEWFANP